MLSHLLILNHVNYWHTLHQHLGTKDG